MTGGASAPSAARAPDRWRAVPPWGWGVLAAALGFAVAYANMRGEGRAGDFYAWYTAARALLNGQSPYDVIPAIDPARFTTPFFYPLTAAIVTIPFAPLPYAFAGALFVALSSGLLAFGVAREGAHHRLWLFASASFVVSASSGTWSIASAAAVMLPALGFVLAAKPNLGVATFLLRPSRWHVAGALLLTALSLALRPTWPMEWLRGLGGVQDRVIPIFTPVGPVLLLALTRWRRREAQLLLGYACVPQAPWFYDQLVLWLIPATALESMHYTVISQVGLVLWLATRAVGWAHGGWALAALLYLPPLVMILRRPNEGSWPPWSRAGASPPSAVASDGKA